MGSWRGLEVDGRLVVVAGGSARALGPVTELRRAGARVRLIGPTAVTALTDLVERGLVEWVHTPLTAADPVGPDPVAAGLAGAALVVTTEPSPALLVPAREAGIVVLEVGSAGPATGAGSAVADGAAESADVRAVGEVVLVGGGPGDPGLLTLAGLAAIESADVIATDRLAPLGIIDRARPEAEIVDVGKIPRGASTSQQAINELLIDRARAGLRVVRFKGGDNFVFGRGGEEWQACAAAGIPVRVIPGVSSAIAAPAAAGIPLTHRSLTQGFVVVSGHVAPDDPRSTVDWPALGRSELTLVLMMGLDNLAVIAAALTAAGRDPGTPAAVVADGTMPSMRVIRADLATIADRASAAGLRPPVTVVIGAVAGFDPTDDGTTG